MAYAKVTLEKMAAYENDGFTIICGNNPFMDKAKKWQNHICVRLARTNSKQHGYCISTVWAVKPK